MVQDCLSSQYCIRFLTRSDKDMFHNVVPQRKLRYQEEHEKINLRIQKKNLDDDDSIEEGIVAIVSYVTSLTLSTPYILKSCIEIKMNLNF